MKIVERGGSKLEDILVRKNPWEGETCGRKLCFPCMAKEKDEKIAKKNCSKRNLVYITWCETCKLRDLEEMKKEAGEEINRGALEDKIKLHMYVGETARSVHERGFEHLDDIRQLKTSSHLLKHLLDKHENETWNEIDFRMEIKTFSRTAFERQIMEACQIQHHRDQHLLNSRSEFNRSAIPRLGLKFGDKEFKDKLKEENEADEKEETLAKKIRELRKQRNRERGGRRRAADEPKQKKRRKNSEDQEYTFPPKEEEMIRAEWKRKEIVMRTQEE
jgi:hypothetical protein